MKRFNSIIVFLAFSSAVLSQWQRVPGPYGVSVISIAADGQKICTSNNEYVCKFNFSSDNANNWISATKGLYEGCAVWGAAIKDTTLFCMVYDTGSGIFRTGTNELFWRRYNNGLPSYFEARQFAFLDSTIFLATDFGVYKSTIQGNLWNRINSGISDTNVLLLTVFGNKLYAGTATGKIYFSSNSGINWSPINTSALPNNQAITAIAVRDSLLIVGINTQGLFRTWNNGATWQPCNTGLPGLTCYNLIFKDSIIFIINSGYGVYRSTDNALTWTAINNGMQFYPYQIKSLVSNDSAILTGTPGGVYKSTDNGNTWAISNNGLCEQAVNFINKSGPYLFAATYISVYRSADSGGTWDVVNKGLGGASYTSLASKNNLLFTGAFYNAPGIYRSENYGESWTLVNNGLSSWGVSSIGVKDTTLFAGLCNDGIFRSADNGYNWSHVLEMQICILSFSTSDSDLFAGDYWGEGIFKSQDNGITWDFFSYNLPFPFNGSMAIKDTIIFAATSHGLYQSSTLNSNWKLITDTISRPVIVTDSSLFAGSSNGVFISTDLGDHWFNVSSGLPSDIYYLYHFFIIDSALYLTDNKGKIWRRPLSEMYILQLQPDTLLLADSLNSLARLYIQTNTDWNIQGSFPPWLTASKLNGKGVDTVLFYSTSVNPDSVRRYASFLLASTKASSIPFTIVQEAFQGILGAIPDSLFLDYTAGSYDSLFITSNTSWDITGTMPGWLGSDHLSGTGSDTVIFSSTETNQLAGARYASFEVSSQKLSPVPFVVIQEGNPGGIDEMAGDIIRIYPNPAQGTICVQLKVPADKITIYNETGAIIEERLTTKSAVQELFTLPGKGIYLIKVTTQKGIYKQKIVVI